jgi:2-dehydro-3-deoxygluconokinase
MKQPGHTVLTAGEALVALVPDTSGPLASAGRLEPFVVGSELNCAVGLARLGIPVEMAGAVGQDPWGTRVRRELGAESVGTQFFQSVADYPTAVMFKDWTGLQGGTRVHYYRSQSPMASGAWDAGPAAAALAARRFRWFHLSGITWAIGQEAAGAAELLMRAARAGGATVSFDLNLRRKLLDLGAWVEILRRALPLVEWLLAGDEELMLLTGARGAEEALTWCRAHGFLGTGVVVRRGPDGAEAATLDGERAREPAWPVARQVDTVGAGDGFDAGFLAARVWGWPLQRSLQLANLVGASALTTRGDHDGFPTETEALAWLEGEPPLER